MRLLLALVLLTIPLSIAVADVVGPPACDPQIGPAIQVFIDCPNQVDNGQSFTASAITYDLDSCAGSGPGLVDSVTKFTWYVDDQEYTPGKDRDRIVLSFADAGFKNIKVICDDDPLYADDPPETATCTVAVERIGPVIYVKPDGSDAHTGYSWASAKRTIAGAMAIADAGKEIWVKAGTYVESVALKSGVGLYGGFSGTETRREQRNWKLNESILQGTYTTSTVTIAVDAESKTIISGFTIWHGKSDCGGGIVCSGGEPIICNNVVRDNVATVSGGGIGCMNASPVIHDNIIAGNNAVADGGGLSCVLSEASIVNNTIVSNEARDGGGISLIDCSPAIANTIVAHNTSGIYASGSAAPILESNCVYGNGGIQDDYVGLTAGKDDHSADPELVDLPGGDCHIQSSSPCLDAGDDNYVGCDWREIDSERRIAGGGVDIGADEYDSALPAIGGTLHVTGGNMVATRSTAGVVTPSTITYTLTNSGDTSISWSASTTSPWICIDSQSGSLAQGAGTTVTITINGADPSVSQACSVYNGAVSFENTTNGNGGGRRTVELTALAADTGCLVVSPSLPLSSTYRLGQAQSSPSQFTYRLKNAGSQMLSWSVRKDVDWLILPAVTTGQLESGEETCVTVQIAANAPIVEDIGVHPGTVTFVDTTNTVDLPRSISLDVCPKGDLVIGPGSDLTGSTYLGESVTGSKEYVLRNLGKHSLDWSASVEYDSAPKDEWLSLSSASGSLQPEESTVVTASFNSAVRELAVGDHGARIDFVNTTDGSGSGSRRAVLEVDSHGQGYLVVNEPVGVGVDDCQTIPKSKAYGPKTYNYVLENHGSTAIEWSASESEAWTSLSLAGGTLSPHGATGDSATVALTVDVAADELSTGQSVWSLISFENLTNGGGNRTGDKACRAYLNISDNGPGPLDLALVKGNELTEPGDLNVSGLLGGPFMPAVTVYRLRNCGDQDLEWKGATSQSWVVLSSQSGALKAGESTDVEVSIDGADTGLGAVDSYEASILFTNETLDGVTDDHSVSVNVDVQDVGTGDLSVETLDGLHFTGSVGGPFSPSSKTYTLTNTSSAGTLDWAVYTVPDLSWLSLSGLSGSLPFGQSAPVTAATSVEATAQGPGALAGSVKFVNSTYGGFVEDSVGITINAPGDGLLSVPENDDLVVTGSAGQWPFGNASISYTLTNCGGTSVDWTAALSISCAAWASVSPSSGTLAPNGGSTDVTVAVTSSAQSLAAGPYSGTVTFVNSSCAENKPVRNISLTVLGDSTAPILVTDDQGFSTTGPPFMPSSKIYRLYNSSSEPVVWTATADVPWVSLSAGSGTLGPGRTTKVRVSTNSIAAGLQGGTYTGNVSFINTSTHAGDATRAVCLVVNGRVATKVVHVSTEGNDSYDGSTWTMAKKTIGAAITEAAHSGGGDVWVQGGTYYEHVTIPAFVHVYGGFAGNEDRVSQREWQGSATILDAQNSGPAVAFIGGSNQAGIDGFTIRGGSGWLDGTDVFGAGIYCLLSSPSITHNIITANSLSSGAGAYGAGICCIHSDAVISNNAITGNKAAGTVSYGGGLYCSSFSGDIYNNTVTANSAASGGGGACLVASPSQFVNNIVSKNSSGILCRGAGAGNPTFENNDVWGNMGYQYRDPDTPTFNPTGQQHNISADPNLYGDMIHTETNSPCLNTGKNPTNSHEAQVIGSLDLDCSNRMLNGVVDIGACEALACLSSGITFSSDCTSARAGRNVSITVTVFNEYYQQGIENADVYLSIAGGAFVMSDGSTSTAPYDTTTGYGGRVAVTVTSETPGTARLTASTRTCNSTVTRSYEVAFRVGGDWPMFGHDPQHTGRADYVGDIESPLVKDNLGFTDGYCYHWVARLPGSSYSRASSPVVFGDTLIIGTYENGVGDVRAYNAATGELRWIGPSTGGMGSGVRSTACIANGKVYVSSTDGYLYCLDLGNGSLLWRALASTAGGYPSPMVASPVVHHNIVYVGSECAAMHAFDADSGSVVSGFPIRLPTDSNMALGMSPAIATVNGVDYLLFGCTDGRIYRINLSDKALSSIDLGGPVESSLSVVGNTAYVGRNATDQSDGGLFKLSIEPFAVVDRTDGNYRDIRSTPALALGSVFVQDYDCDVQFLNCEVGGCHTGGVTAFSQGSPLSGHYPVVDDIATADPSVTSVAIAADNLAIGVSGEYGGLLLFSPRYPRRYYQKYWMPVQGRICSSAVVSTNVDDDGNMWLFVRYSTGGEDTLAGYQISSKKNGELPVFSPDAGTYDGPIYVTMSSAGGHVKYTANGMDPTGYGDYYREPILVSQNTTLKAKVFDNGSFSNPVKTAFYRIVGLAAPTFSPDGGTYHSEQSVTIDCATSGAEIRYTTDGTEPNEYSAVYAGPVVADSNMTLKAKAFVTGESPSETKSAIYEFAPETPTFAPDGGEYAGPQSVTMTCPTSGAYILYTTDGSDPVSPTGMRYSGPVAVASDLVLKAVAFRAAWSRSATKRAEYTISSYVTTPTFSKLPGYYTQPQSIDISCSTPGATIYYTTDGTDPQTTGSGAASPVTVPVTTTTTIRAVATKAGFDTSALAKGTYTITGQVATPIFTPGPAYCATPQQVTISSSTPRASIYYTTDGSIPTPAAGTPYNGPVQISQTTTIKAIAVEKYWDDSAVATATYDISRKLATPTFVPEGGTYNSAQEVWIHCRDTGVDIYYTTDGSDPAADSNTSQLYDPLEPIIVDGDVTLKARALKTGYEDSDIASASYVINSTGRLPKPTSSIPEGVYGSAQDVTISCVPSDATIFYTTDGTEPVATGGGLTAPVTVHIAGTTVIKARSAKAGWQDSAVASARYVITANKTATPVFDPPSGTYGADQDVAITCASASAEIYYTTDGREPTKASTLYTGTPIPVSHTTTVRARAYRTGYQDSDIATGHYTIATNQMSMPSFDPIGMASSTPITVSISCGPADAVILFTTDGSEPALSTTSTSVYTRPIVLNATTTIKAKALRSGWLDSAVASDVYTITAEKASQPTISPDGGAFTQAVAPTCSTATENAHIHYTLDTSTPDESSPLWDGTLSISKTTVLKVRAFRSDLLPSDVETATFHFGSGPYPYVPVPGWAEDIIPTDASSSSDGPGPSSAGSVNLATGVSANDPDADISVYNPYGPSISYSRSYRSSLAQVAAHSPGLSGGWVDNYSTRLLCTPGAWTNKVTVVYPDGASEALSAVVDGQNLVTYSILGGTYALLNPDSKAPYFAYGDPVDAVNLPGEWNSITLRFSDESTCRFVPPDPTNRPGLYRLDQIAELQGSPITLSYVSSSDDRPTGIACGTAQLMSFQYDGVGHLSQITDLLGNRKVKYGFSSATGYLTSVSQLVPGETADPPVWWSYTYDPDQSWPCLVDVAVPDSLGNQQHSVINFEAGHVSSTVDANGNTRSYAYRGNETDVTVRDRDGALALAYTQKIGPNSENVGGQDVNGNQTYITYKDSLPVSSTNANGQTTRIGYGDYGRVETITDPDGFVASLTYGDTTGNDPANLSRFRLNQVDSSGKDAAGNTVSKIPTKYGYENGRLKHVWTPRPGAARSQGSQDSWVETTFYYDGLGRTESVTSPAPNDTPGAVTTTRYYYSGNSNLPARVATFDGTEQSGRVTSEVSYTYDTSGRVTSVTDGNLATTDILYLDQYQKIYVYYPATGNTGTGRAVTGYSYNSPNGTLSNVREWDESIQLVRETDMDTGPEYEFTGAHGGVPETSYSRDAAGRIRKVTDARGNSTKADYDPVGNLNSITRPLGNGDGWEFDADGNPTAHTDGKGRTAYYRDPRDSRLVAMQKPDGYLSYKYDAFGRVVEEKNEVATITYTYDDNDLVLRVRTLYPGLQNQVIDYTYYPDGSRRSMHTWFGDYNYSYGYDSGDWGQGMVTGVTFPWQPYTPKRCYYDTNGRLVRETHTESIYTDYTYNRRGWLRSLTNCNTAIVDNDSNEPSIPSEFSEMAYDSLGNLTRMRVDMPAVGELVDYVATVDYAYDSQGRLCEEKRTGRYGNMLYRRHIGYDSVGNATSVTSQFSDGSGDTNNYTYDANDRPFGNVSEGSSFGYDANDNPWNWTPNADVDYGFNYDSSDQVTQVIGGYDCSGYLSMNYRSDGLRAWKEGSKKTYFIYDGDVVLYEVVVDATSVSTCAYGYDTNGLMEQADIPNDGISEKCGYCEIYQFDPMGSLVTMTCRYPRSVPSYRSRVTQRVVYDAFGNVLESRSSSNGADFPSPNSVGCQGQWGAYSDQETCKDAPGTTATQEQVAALAAAGDPIARTLAVRSKSTKSKRGTSAWIATFCRLYENYNPIGVWTARTAWKTVEFVDEKVDRLARSCKTMAGTIPDTKFGKDSVAVQGRQFFQDFPEVRQTYQPAFRSVDKGARVADRAEIEARKQVIYYVAGGVLGKAAKGTAAMARGAKAARLAEEAAEAAAATGQDHHILSQRILRALAEHETLAGKFSRKDPAFRYRAADNPSHIGYQTWHRNVDTEVVTWLERNPRATPAEFKAFLTEIYQRPGIRERIPGVRIK